MGGGRLDGGWVPASAAARQQAALALGAAGGRKSGAGDAAAPRRPPERSARQWLADLAAAAEPGGGDAGCRPPPHALLAAVEALRAAEGAGRADAKAERLHRATAAASAALRRGGRVPEDLFEALGAAEPARAAAPCRLVAVYARVAAAAAELSAEAAERLGDTCGALRQAETAAELAPLSPAHHARLARLHRAAGDTVAAARAEARADAAEGAPVGYAAAITLRHVAGAEGGALLLELPAGALPDGFMLADHYAQVAQLVERVLWFQIPQADGNHDWLARLRDAVQVRPFGVATATMLHSLANVFAGCGDWLGSSLLYTAALELMEGEGAGGAPADLRAFALHNRAVVRLRTGDAAGSSADALAALDAQPGWVSAHLRAADAALAARDSRRATPHLDAARAAGLPTAARAFCDGAPRPVADFLAASLGPAGAALALDACDFVVANVDVAMPSAPAFRGKRRRKLDAHAGRGPSDEVVARLCGKRDRMDRSSDSDASGSGSPRQKRLNRQMSDERAAAGGDARAQARLLVARHGPPTVTAIESLFHVSFGISASAIDQAAQATRDAFVDAFTPKPKEQPASDGDGGGSFQPPTGGLSFRLGR